MTLDTPLSSAISTKPEYLAALKEIGLLTVRDLLLYFPRAYEETAALGTLGRARDGEKISVEGQFFDLKAIPLRGKKLKMIRGLFLDSTGAEAEAVWFNQPHILRMVPLHTPVRVAAKAQRRFGRLSLQNPVVERVQATTVHGAGLTPVYAEHGTLITSKWLREKIHPLLQFATGFEDLIPPMVRIAEALMTKAEAVRECHFPSSPALRDRARDTLGYEELYLLQLAALRAKKSWQKSRNAASQGMALDPEWVKGFFSTLPFEPTGAQKIVIYEILKDMEKPFPMLRLLEGDVGSGKTMVAVVALLQAIHYGYQAALMAPTEVLARQHAASIAAFIDRYERAFVPKKPITLELLVGALASKEKDAVTQGIALGQVDLVVGTHALIQEGVRFHRLGLVVIDEQHRFGVKQRESLVRQGSPHVLTMTATPIPRTLAQVAYGDQDLSVIGELPPGRPVIRTAVVAPHQRGATEIFSEEEIAAGRQMYVICPLIESSDTLEVKSATEEQARLSRRFPRFSVGLLHGRMKSEEKDAVMQAFKDHALDILVSTSVIEVGIDVPNATLIWIEGADRFGLSQLHQFRGRVGRGKVQSYCFLATDSDSPPVMMRLKAMVEHADGFRLAELDMQWRGPGEVYGVRQSGLPDLKMANLMNGVLLDRVRKAAQEAVEIEED